MNPEPADPPIDLRHVIRRFGRAVAVDDLSLQVPRGAICGFIGLNGAGKSTTIRMAVGLLKPTGGTVRVAGCDVVRDHVELCRRIGYVPDRPNVYGWMRVGQAVDFVRRFHGERWDQARCADLFRRFRLPTDQRVAKLSKGQATKLQLLLACCHNPSVLILDEPTSGFDPIVREEFLESILRVADDGERQQTVLLSSHALADVQRLADRVAILHEGRLLMHGSVDELLARVKRVRLVVDGSTTPAPHDGPGVLRRVRDGRALTLTLDGGPTADAIAALATRFGATSVSVSDVSLDDLFKDLIRGKEEGTCFAH